MIGSLQRSVKVKPQKKFSDYWWVTALFALGIGAALGAYFEKEQVITETVYLERETQFSYEELDSFDRDGNDLGAWSAKMKTDRYEIRYAPKNEKRLLVIDRELGLRFSYDQENGHFDDVTDMSKVDIVFVFDVSGTMLPYIELLRSTFSHLTARYAEDERLRVGYIAAEPGKPHVVQSLGSIETALTHFLQLEIGDEGSDTAYSAYRALVSGKLDEQLGFRERSQRVIIVLSDEKAQNPYLIDEWTKADCVDDRSVHRNGPHILIHTHGRHSAYRKSWGEGVCGYAYINIEAGLDEIEGRHFHWIWLVFEQFLK